MDLTHYKTQIGIIDDDHKEIYAMIRELIADSINRIPVTEKLETLKGKLEEHCATEEEIMIQIQFPYFEYHKAAHFQVMEYFHFMTVSSNLMNIKFLLQNFEIKFSKHIEDYDMQIYPFIRQE
jgi:hemerythrin-like metal-binding protein